MEGAVLLILSIKKNPKSKMENLDISVSRQLLAPGSKPVPMTLCHQQLPPSWALICMPREKVTLWSATLPSSEVLSVLVAVQSVMSQGKIVSRSWEPRTWARESSPESRDTETPKTGGRRTLKEVYRQLCR